MGLDRDNLENLRRQVEEDFRLDVAAIERLQRRYISAGSTTSISPVPAYSGLSAVAPADSPALEPRPENQPDELTGSLRAMFSGQRR
jgi:hypothetical protein